MKRISIFFYSIRQGFKNIKQNGMFSMASIGTMAACLFLLGIFYFVVSNFQFMIHNAETSVGVTVFFEEGITDEQIQNIGVKINERPEVKEVVYTSPEDAWKNFQDEVFQEEKDLTDTFAEDNPLKDSASYGIYVKDISKQKDLVKYLKNLDGIRLVNSSDNTASGLHKLNTLISYVSAAIIGILLIVAIFLINTTVSMGISVRKEEIHLMKLIGATDFFIRAPFIVEGIVIGMIGALIPLGILLITYERVISYITIKFFSLSNILVFLEPGKVFVVLVPLSLGIGVGIGLLGSIWTVRKHLYV